MIHSVGMEASEALEASRLMSEPLTSSITIGDMRIDDKGNIQFKDNYDSWVTVDINKPTISNIDCHGTTYTIKDNVSKYFNIEGLQYYDKKIKEYIDNRIDEKLANITKIKYKVIFGED